jgi:hypothetical protein
MFQFAMPTRSQNKGTPLPITNQRHISYYRRISIPAYAIEQQ